MTEFEKHFHPNTQNQQARYSFASSCLRANLQQTPNEDFLLTDELSGVFILVDGVTRTNFGQEYPSPSPAAIASERFSTAAYERLLGADTINLPARERVLSAVRAGNSAVYFLNQMLFGDSIDYLGTDFAGTVGMIALTEGHSLIIGYTGDVRAYGTCNNEVKLLTDIQTNKVAQLRKSSDGWSDKTTLHIRRDIRNNSSHEMGFGVFTGEDASLDFVRILEVELGRYDSVLLATDGIADIAGNDLGSLKTKDLELLADRAQEYSKSSGKKVDDIGLILIDCAKYLTMLKNNRNWRRNSMGNSADINNMPKVDTDFFAPGGDFTRDDKELVSSSSEIRNEVAEEISTALSRLETIDSTLNGLREPVRQLSRDEQASLTLEQGAHLLRLTRHVGMVLETLKNMGYEDPGAFMDIYIIAAEILEGKQEHPSQSLRGLRKRIDNAKSFLENITTTI